MVAERCSRETGRANNRSVQRKRVKKKELAGFELKTTPDSAFRTELLFPPSVL